MSDSSPDSFEDEPSSVPVTKQPRSVNVLSVYKPKSGTSGEVQQLIAREEVAVNVVSRSNCDYANMLKGFTCMCKMGELYKRPPIHRTSKTACKLPKIDPTEAEKEPLLGKAQPTEEMDPDESRSTNLMAWVVSFEEETLDVRPYLTAEYWQKVQETLYHVFKSSVKSGFDPLDITSGMDLNGKHIWTAVTTISRILVLLGQLVKLIVFMRWYPFNFVLSAEDRQGVEILPPIFVQQGSKTVEDHRDALLELLEHFPYPLNQERVPVQHPDFSEVPTYEELQQELSKVWDEEVEIVNLAIHIAGDVLGICHRIGVNSTFGEAKRHTVWTKKLFKKARHLRERCAYFIRFCSAQNLGDITYITRVNSQVAIGLIKLSDEVGLLDLYFRKNTVREIQAFAAEELKWRSSIIKKIP